MKLPEHLALSYLLAQFGVQQEFGPAGTALMIAAGVLPDLDTLTILGGWKCHRRYHRVLGHGLPVTLLGPPALAGLGTWLLGSGSFFLLWFSLQVSLLFHLLTDILFYNWPARLAWPLSSRGVAFSLMTWNDLVPTAVLYAGTVVALIWPKAATDAAVASVAALALYIAWRAWQPRARTGMAAWITGDWAQHSPRWSRWLTGDFIT